jgi:hypothetical protein
MEDCEIYGYVTVSDVKILALLKRESIIPLKRRKENDIKELFVSLIKVRVVSALAFLI